MFEVSPVRATVLARSGGMCEAMVRVGEVWTRCGISPVDDHHMLTRARGGALLDEVGETYHHLALCRRHHSYVDEYGIESGLVLAGTVYRAADRLIYRGPDAYLSATYPTALEVSVVPDTVSSAITD